MCPRVRGRYLVQKANCIIGFEPDADEGLAGKPIGLFINMFLFSLSRDVSQRGDLSDACFFRKR